VLAPLASRVAPIDRPPSSRQQNIRLAKAILDG
jgi:hypothetical protein